MNSYKDEIKKIIPIDKKIKIGKKEYQKHTLYLSHIIEDYHLAYTKAKENEINPNSLASLKKGNVKRKKRYEENEKVFDDKSKPDTIRLIAFFENLILKKFLDGDYKLAFLVLSLAFMFRPQTEVLLKRLFFFHKGYRISLDSLIESLKFYEFTILSPSKIVSSTAICIYQYLKHVAKIEDEKKILKFIRDIINIHFSKHAPQELRKDMFEREFYCAGIFNQTPIFQWYVPKEKKSLYYTDKDIEKYYEYTNHLFNDNTMFNQIIYKLYSKNMPSKTFMKDTLTSKEGLKLIISNLSIAYVKNPSKLMDFIYEENRKNSFWYKLKSIFR